jgi:NAD(P)H-flavin reductase
VISAIEYVVENRPRFGRLVIMQSVKHHTDLLWRKSYDEWRELPNTQVLLAASHDKANWPNWELGRVASLFDDAIYDKKNCTVMMCGPDGMMKGAARMLSEVGVPEAHIFLSLERSMQCGIGHCGHCQFSGHFVCKDGPVFSYPEVKEVLGHKGF